MAATWSRRAMNRPELAPTTPRYGVALLPARMDDKRRLHAWQGMGRRMAPPGQLGGDFIFAAPI